MTDVEDKVIIEARSQRWSEPERAVRLLEEFVLEWKQAVRSRLLLASLYADDYGEGVAGAERMYREVLASNPDNLAGLCGLALLHGRSRGVSSDESLSLLAKAASISKDPEMLLNFANKAWDLRRFDVAAEGFDKLRQVAKEHGKDHLANVAMESLKEVRARRTPANVSYSHPEIA
jgi:hypothetical protein